MEIGSLEEQKFTNFLLIHSLGVSNNFDLSSNNTAGYSHTETYPIIARLIIEINTSTKQWAKRSDVKAKFLIDVDGSVLLNNAIKLSEKTAEWTAGNMFDFWSKDMTTRSNPFLGQFSRNRIDDETAYWSVSLGNPPNLQDQVVTESRVEQTAFALEEQLEEFLILNWEKLDLGKKYKILKNEANKPSQFRIDNHILDILAESFDGKELLVIELKRGKTSDQVVGQILRYMGVVKEKKAKPDQEVSGLIIGGQEDENVRLALSNIKNVEFNTYNIEFTLVPQQKKGLVVTQIAITL